MYKITFIIYAMDNTTFYTLKYVNIHHRKIDEFEIKFMLQRIHSFYIGLNSSKLSM